jgi:ketosteroid isomerase-like protein
MKPFFRNAIGAFHLQLRFISMTETQELENIQRRLVRAWLERDRATVEQIIAPDWISTGADGAITTRADLLRNVFDLRAFEVLGLTTDDISVRVFGDAAVVTGRTQVKGRAATIEYASTIRFTDVFIRRHDRWQAVASHTSLLAPSVQAS